MSALGGVNGDDRTPGGNGAKWLLEGRALAWDPLNGEGGRFPSPGGNHRPPGLRCSNRKNKSPSDTQPQCKG